MTVHPSLTVLRRICRPLVLLFLLAVTGGLAQATSADAAVAYRASTCGTETWSFATVTTLTLAKPAGTVNGDLMVMTLYSSNGWNGGGGPPAGWTELLSSGSSFSAYRIASGEPASYDVASGAFTSGKAGATISTFTGIDPSAPFATAGSNATGSDASVELPNTTSTRTGSMRFSPITVGSARSTTFTGLTEASDCAADAVGVSSGYEPINAGTTTSRTATLSGTGAWVGQTYVLQPPPPPPDITAISPSAGPVAGGTSVTITGTAFVGLSGAAAVRFGATNATSYTVDSATQITATAPAGTGTQNVSVTTPDGTSANTAADDYTYYAPPTVTSLAPNAGPQAGGTSVTITGTNFAGLSGAAAVRFGATNATSYTVNSATSITATAPAGTGAQNVTVTTPGGTSANTAADDYTYYAPPTVTSLSPAAGPNAGGTSVTVTGTNFAGLSGAAAVQFGGVNASGYTVNSATSITATAPAGTGTADVRVTTPGGTSANTASDDYTYYPPPTITSIAPTSGPAAGGTVITITGTNFAGLSGAAAVRFGATNAASYTVVNPTTITATAPAGTGTENVSVTTPGGTTANTAADDYTYIPAPTVTSLSPAAGPNAGGGTITITGTNFTGASQVQFGGVDATGYTVVNATTITATAPAGTGAVDVRVTTPGGVSANTAADNYLYYAPPTVDSLSPSSGPAGGGTLITITGTNFGGLSGAGAVQFGGVDATSYTVVNATTITATAPAGTGTVNVRVTTPGGTSANSAADDFTYIPAPTVDALSPSAGPVAGGTGVTITGTNLTGATQVQFGGVNATGVTVVNATTITATAPAGTGTVDVRVTTPGGTSANTAADDFTYVPAPTVTSLSPTSGPIVGGTAVTITGTNLTGATQVQFGGVNASGYSVVNATTITATAPAGTGTVDVRVTTAGGTSANTAADDFVYIPAPAVTALSPSAGPTTGGNTVTVTGTNLSGATQVQFGGIDATGYTVVNATTITATAPAGAGTVDVRVTTPSGTSANTAADDYTYVTPPTVTAVSPANGPTGGGGTVTISGTGFTGTTQVQFGGTDATGYTVVNATTITATAPPHAAGSVDVRVTTAGGTSANTAADNYLFADPPVVSSLAPSTGPGSGGTTVTITGTFFTGATDVAFGATPATGFTVDSPTQITATAPAGVGIVDVRVTTAGGLSANTAADDFTYIAAPAITSLSPVQGPEIGGTTVTITGTALTGATAVTFDGAAATGYTVVNATTITATAPTHAPGFVDVRVTTPGGTSPNTAADDYEYVYACGQGTLALTVNDFSFTPFALTGLDTTSTTSAAVQVSDMTAPGAGWKLEVGTTQFTAGPGRVLPASAASITNASATPQGSSCSAPTNAVNAYPIPLPLSPSKVKVYNAAVGSGLGPVDVNFDVALDVPASTRVGTYTSTWTFDLTAAP